MAARPPRPRAGARSRRSSARHDDEAHVIDCLRRLFKAVHEHSKAIHRTVGLSAPQVWALTILREEPDLSLGELSDRMFAHPSTVSGVVDRLVQRQAVNRLTDPQDRRGVRLSLTPIGRRLLRTSPSPVQHGLRRALEAMPAARLRQLRGTLEELVGQTEASRMEAPLFEVDEPRPTRRRA